MEFLINLVGYISAFILGFGVMSEGSNRLKIRKLGMQLVFVVLLISLLYSVFAKNLFIIGFLLNLIYIFLGTTFVLWILFKYILKVSTYQKYEK